MSIVQANKAAEIKIHEIFVWIFSKKNYVKLIKVSFISQDSGRDIKYAKSLYYGVVVSNYRFQVIYYKSSSKHAPGPAQIEVCILSTVDGVVHK